MTDIWLEGEKVAELWHDYISSRREHPQSCLDSLNCENEIWLKKQTNTKIHSEILTECLLSPT